MIGTMIKPCKSEGVAILAVPSYIFIELDWKTMLRWGQIHTQKWKNAFTSFNLAED
jgi:hypothetical protein